MGGEVGGNEGISQIFYYKPKIKAHFQTADKKKLIIEKIDPQHTHRLP